MNDIKRNQEKHKKKNHPNKIDLVGKKFGRLTVLEDTGKRPGRRVVYKCLCDCGNMKEVHGGNLSSGKSKSCGCLKGSTEDLTGKAFGELTVLEELRERKNGNKVWLCECSCGKTHKANTNMLKIGQVKSCGCSISPDISGKRFGRLSVIKETGETVGGQRTWHCSCDCGGEVVTNRTALKVGRIRSCGCLVKEQRKNFASLMNEYRHLNSGKKHYNYNPGLTDEDRTKMRYEISGEDRRVWRKNVYIRDNYTCQVCNKKGRIVAHHLNGYHWHEEGRYEIDNGVTLCNDCHLGFHKNYGFGENTEEQFNEYKKTKK